MSWRLQYLGRFAMMMYTIENTISGVILGTYDAKSEAHALDLMAQDAGYKDYAEAQRVAPSMPGEIIVIEEERMYTLY